MKQLNNSKQQALLPSAVLLKDVYSIIDSRIQYIEYQAHCRMKNCIGGEDHSSSNGRAGAGLQPTSDMLANNFDQMLTFVNGLSMPLKLLQILKSWLREDNVPLIMSLLYNNTYLEYSEDHLEKMLKKEAIELLV